MTLWLSFQSARIADRLARFLLASFLVCAPTASLQAQQDRQLVQTGSPNQATNKRIALVIGNGAYTSAPPLKNPPNDARDMAATLRTLGFDVSSGINVGQREMKRLIREFGLKLKNGGSGLFYYAGHGVQSKGRNYLIPVDANIQSEAEVEDSSVDAALVLNFMDDAQNGLNIVILDACRNNPFAHSFRSASDGLAQVDAPTGTLIAYATAPGRVASDGTGQNGLYTSELLKQMQVPGVSITDVFMRVRAEVMKQTGSKQVPWEASSLVGSFYFSRTSGTSSANAANSAIVNQPRDDAAAFELSYWDSIKNSSDPADFTSYLEQYPAGRFGSLAKNRLKALEGAKTSSNLSSPNRTSSNAAAPLAACFGTDQGVASTNWSDHYSWAQNQSTAKLKLALEQKLELLFRCPLRTDEQSFDDFAALSVLIARYVPDPACFNGDAGVVSTDSLGHRNWAMEKGRAAALDNLKSKASTAVGCLAGSKRVSYYADVSVLVAGGSSTQLRDANPSGNSQPFSGGILNGKAILLVEPDYPPIARAAHASGQVQVQVLIDEAGNVISASAVSGHPLLQAAAANAALASKFTPTKLSGQPVKVRGFIIYNFSLRK